MDATSRSAKKIYYFGTAGTILLLFILLFIFISHRLTRNIVLAFDHQAISFVQSFISPNLTEWMLRMTFLGSVKWITIGVILTGIILFVKNKKSLFIFLAASSGLGALVNILLKWIFKRDRPDILALISEQGYSFPSGHSMGSFIFYGSLAYIIIHLVHQKSWRWVAIIINSLLILIIGLSRIYLGVHFPSDIIGGFSAGAAWLLICIILFRYYEYRHDL